MSNSIKLSPKYGVNPTMPICFFCGNTKNEVALLGKIGKGKDDFEAPRQCLLDYEPCEECKKKMEGNVTAIGVLNHPMQNGQPPIRDGLYPSGSYFVMRKGVIKRMFTNMDDKTVEEIEDKGNVLLEDEVVKQIINMANQVNGEENE